jgi:hypothetical protein
MKGIPVFFGNLELWENHDPDFEATPCEHSSVAICGQASSHFLNIRCDQRGPSELVKGNIYQNLSEPALSTDLSSVMRDLSSKKAVSQFREISERAIERGILREDFASSPAKFIMDSGNLSLENE